MPPEPVPPARNPAAPVARPFTHPPVPGSDHGIVLDAGHEAPRPTATDAGPSGPREPYLHPQVPLVGAGLSADVVRRVTNESVERLLRCYQTALASAAGLEGRVLLTFLIAANGTVSDAAIADTNIASPLMGRCLTSEVRRWRFPAPEPRGTVTVVYPLLFGLASVDH